MPITLAIAIVLLFALAGLAVGFGITQYFK